MHYFALTDPLNILLLAIDITVVLAVVLYVYIKYNTKEACKNITISKRNLIAWRYGLYGAILSAFFGGYTTFIYPSPLRISFHMVTLIGAILTLSISLPAYICKIRKISFDCNCDYYTYQDFPLVAMFGALGTLSFLFVPIEKQP